MKYESLSIMNFLSLNAKNLNTTNFCQLLRKQIGHFYSLNREKLKFNITKDNKYNLTFNITADIKVCQQLSLIKKQYIMIINILHEPWYLY